jgi:threonine aldolase
MRQVGMLAAAALYALEHNIDRLAEDHKNAKLLATEIAKIQDFQINPEHVETNIVVFDVSNSELTVDQVLEKMKAKDILMVPFGRTLVRAVTNLNVSLENIETTIQVIHELFD